MKPDYTELLADLRQAIDGPIVDREIDSTGTSWALVEVRMDLLRRVLWAVESEWERA